MIKVFYGRIRFLVCAFFLLIVCINGANAKQFTVGVSFDDAKDPQFIQLLNLIEYELDTLSSEDLQLEVSQEHLIDGQSDLQQIAKNNKTLLSDNSVDMVLGLGVFSSNFPAKEILLSKPVLSPIVIDYQQQGFQQVDGKSIKNNLTFLTSFRSFVNEIKDFRELVNFSSLAIILDKNFRADSPLLQQLKEKVVDANDYAVEFVFYDGDTKKLAQQLSKGIDAVYVSPLSIPEAEIPALFEVINSLRLPSFAMPGKDYVKKGALLATVNNIDSRRLARRVALVIQQLALGVPATELSVLFVQDENLSINMQTAKKVGYSPEWNILNEAELIGLDADSDLKKLSLKDAIQIAEESNLELLHSQQKLGVLEQDISIARSNLYPNIKFDLGRIDVDQDHVSPYQYQHETKATVTISQVLYSDLAHAGVDIQKYLQEAEQSAVDTKRLDVIYQTASKYIEALYLKTLLNVKKENLKLTRSNLGLAKLRESVGYSRLSDVHRWENKLATDRKGFDETYSQYLQLQNKLNQILNLPQSEQYKFEELDNESSYFLIDSKQIFDYIETPNALTYYRNFSVQKGVANAYEIKQLESSLKSLQRLVVNKKRSLWVPEVALRGQVNEALSQSGDGGQLLVGKDDTSWNTALMISWNLAQGGAKFADLSKAELEYGRLLTEKVNAEKNIELNIRSSLHKLMASHLGIANSRKAFAAAKKNLNLVQDAYVKGAVSVLDLIDAQHVANISKEGVAGSKYEFLLDFIAYQRAIGRFFFLMPEEQQKQWLQQYITYKNDMAYKQERLN